MKPDRRGSWYLLTGAVLGIALGLIYSWVISPVKYVDAPPYALRADFKDEYRALIAAAYLYSYDLIRAEDRLAQLKDDDVLQSLTRQAQQALTEGHPEAEVRALGSLALALGQGTSQQTVNTAASTTEAPMPTGIIKTPTAILILPMESQLASQTSNPPLIISTATPPPTNPTRPMNTEAPSPTQGSGLILLETRLICNPDQAQPLIQIQVQDAAGQPVPSIELVVTWEGGEDRFYTGLKPELGLGYADFLMMPEVLYSLRLAEGGQAINDISAAECLLEDGDRYWGSWLFTFTQS